MARLAALAFASAFLSASALAEDEAPRGDACVLTVHDTVVGPKKPHEIVLQLDCGAKPTEAQALHVAQISNLRSMADGVQLMTGAGYEIEGYTAFVTFTGSGVTHVFTFVQDAGAPAAPSEDEGLDDAAEPAPSEGGPGGEDAAAPSEAL
jgi:hypothetical protein